MTPRVLLVPFPITPLTALAYFLLRRIGKIDAEILIRYSRASAARPTQFIMSDGVVCNLAALMDYRAFEALVPHVGGAEGRALKKLMTYCADGDPGRGYPLNRWLANLALATNEPAPVLATASELFTAWLEQGLDPWRREKLPLPRVPRARPPAYPLDRRILTLPVIKSDEVGKEEISDQARFELREGKIFELMRAHVGVVVGGPAGSGKSTLVASLTAGVRDNVESLKTRHGWEKLELTVEAVDLDLGTPTLNAIATGRGWEREELATLKQPWTQELALAALERFAAAKARANIVFADLPGGPVGTITEIAAAAADAAILLSWDWGLMSEWRAFLNRLGIALVSQARSYRDEDARGLTSMMRLYAPGRIFTGRIVGLDRVGRSWDRFISWQTEFLPFDILPAIITKRREKLEQFLGDFDEEPEEV